LKIHIEQGDLSLRSQGSGFEICHKCVDSDSIYVIAFIRVGKEDCDLLTVGMRPWTTETSPRIVLEFCRLAMTIVNGLMNSPEETE
jgi:hypothetical protein